MDDDDRSISSTSSGKKVEFGDDYEEEKNEMKEEESETQSFEYNTSEPAAAIVTPNANGIIEHFEEYHFPMYQYPIAPSQRILSSFPFIWKGVEWTTFLVVQNGMMGVYLGYEHPESLPDNFRANIAYRYTLLTMGGKELDEGSPCQFIFTKDKNKKPAERFDHGNSSMFNIFNHYEIRRGNQFSFKLKLRIKPLFEATRAPYNHNSKAATGMVGLENLGATCYLNSLLQMLFHLNSFRRAVYQIPYEKEDYRSSTTLALQNVFRNLQCSKNEVTTKDLTVAFGWTSVEAFMQQDVQEMMRILIDKLEDKMKGTTVDGYAKELFCGKLKSYIRCINVDYVSSREEEFYDIQLDVKGCKNIYESFEKYTSIEVLDGENQYDSGKYGKQDAKKGVIFTKFPPVLTVQLKRFDFDLETMGFRKIHDCFAYPARLNVDKYLDPEIRTQEGEEGNQTENSYLLHSVLVHAGDVGGGHYYAYLRPSTEHNYRTVYGADKNSFQSVKDEDLEWFKFNDETVLQVPKYEANDYCFGRRKTSEEFDGYGNIFAGIMSSAYMLVYVREQEAPTIMQPIAEEEIPQGLLQRLMSEERTRRLEEMRVLRQRRFLHFGYIEEQDIATFSNYTRIQGFIDESSFRRAPIMTDSFVLGVVLDLCETLGTYPIMVRLWIVDKQDKSYGIGELIPTYQYTRIKIKENSNRYFVEHILPEDAKEDENVQFFIQEYQKLMADQQEWLGKLKETLLNQIPELTLLFEQAEGEGGAGAGGGEEESESGVMEVDGQSSRPSSSADDIVSGCGIGKSNKPLDDLKPFNQALYEELKTSIRTLTIRMIELIERYGQGSSQEESAPEIIQKSPVKPPPPPPPLAAADENDQNEEKEKEKEKENGKVEEEEEEEDEDNAMLIFFKVYDPLDILDLPTWKQQPHHPQRPNLPQRQTSADELMIKLEFSDLQPYDDATFCHQKTKGNENLIKYLGYASCKGSDDVKIVPNLFQQLLLDKMNSRNNTPHSNNQNNYLELLKNSDFYIFHVMDSPMNMKPINFQETTQCNNYFYEGGGSVIATFNDEFYHEMDIDTTGSRTNPLAYFKYKFQTRWLEVHPFNQREEFRTLYYSRKFRSYQENILRKKRMEEEQIEDKLSGKKRAHEGEGGLGDNHTNGDDAETYQIISSLEFEINSTDDRIEDIVTRIAETLNVDRTHLIVYFEPFHEQSRGMYDYQPWTIYDHRTFLSFIQQDLVQWREALEKSSPHNRRNYVNLLDKPFVWIRQQRFHVFYRITPDPVVITIDHRLTMAHETYQTAEFLLTDDRLRRFRKAFLLHSVKQYPETKELLIEFEENGNSNSAANDSNKRQKTDGANGNVSGDASDEPEQEGQPLTLTRSLTSSSFAVPSSSASSIRSLFDFVDPATFPFSDFPPFRAYCPLDASKVIVRGSKTTRIDGLCSFMRLKVFGMSLQEHSELMNGLRQQFHEHLIANGDDEEILSEEEMQAYLRQLKEDGPKNHLNDFPANICSEELTFLEVSSEKKTDQENTKEGDGWFHETQMDEDNSSKPTADNHKPDEDTTQTEQKESEEVNKNVYLSPAFPLILTLIEDNRIVEIVPGSKNFDRLYPCWFEAKQRFRPRRRMGMQFLDPYDIIWMRNEHPSIRSMLITVFSFTLMGNAVQPCDCEMFGGPCITYLREDDTVLSLAHRIEILTGDKDLSGNRFAIVKDNVPHFLPRAQASLGAPSSSQLNLDQLAQPNADSESQQQQQQPVAKAPESLWDIAQKHFSEFAKGEYATVQLHARAIQSGPYQHPHQHQHQPPPPPRFPALGIQRSSVDVDSMNNRNKLRKKRHNGIKIS